jgi:hypothetical protein
MVTSLTDAGANSSLVVGTADEWALTISLRGPLNQVIRSLLPLDSHFCSLPI